MSNNVGVKLKLKGIQELLENHQINDNGRVQTYIDSEVVRLCTPYVPFDTGMLAVSAQMASDYGSGEVIYNTPYAAKQYYGNSGKGMRGKQWFERMKADHLNEILDGAKKMAGGD